MLACRPARRTVQWTVPAFGPLPGLPSCLDRVPPAGPVPKHLPMLVISVAIAMEPESSVLFEVLGGGTPPPEGLLPRPVRWVSQAQAAGGGGSDAIVASAWIALGIVFLLPNFPDNVGWFPSIIRFLLLAFVVFFVCWFLVEPKVLIGTFPLMGGVQEMKHLAPMPQWYRWVAPTCL